MVLAAFHAAVTRTAASGAPPALPWAWTAYQLLALLRQYPAGVTPAMAAAELERLWSNTGSGAGTDTVGQPTAASGITPARPVALDAIVRDGSVSSGAYVEADVVEVRNLDTVPIAVLADSQSERRIEAYLHRQLLPLVRGAGPAGAPPSPLCRLRLARCRVSDAAGNGRSAMPRLLPTPLAVVVVHDEATLPPAMAQLWAGATRSIPDAVCHVRSAAHSSSSAVAASPRLAMWAFVSAVEPAVDTLPSPYGARHRVRAVWLRSTKSAADSASDDSHDADTACLRLWDDQCAVADLLQPVRCRATVAPARSRGRRRKRRDRAASLSPSPWPAPLMDTASRRRPVCYPRATRWACGRPRCRACRPFPYRGS